MSKYTTEIRYICEEAAGLNASVGYHDVDKVLDKATAKIFDFDFPIFDEGYRLGLEKKILKHYYTREICAETVGLWKLWLSARMNDIMPYYNKLYQSELIKFEPLNDVDVTTTRKDKFDSKGSNEGKTKGTNDAWSLYSDTPQGDLDGVKDNNYLTNARQDTGEGTTETEDKSTFGSTDDWIEHKAGRNGGFTASKSLKEFRETFLNIDMLIINELKDLFFNLW